MDDSIILPHRHEFRVSIENMTLRVLTTSSEKNINLSPTAKSDRHIHAYCEVFVCVRGEAVLSTEKGDLILESGMIAIVPPGVSHICLSTDRGGWDSIGLLVSKRRVRGCANLYDATAGFLYMGEIKLFRDEEEIAERLYHAASDTDADRIITPLTVLTDLLYLREKSCFRVSRNTAFGGGSYDINQLAQLEQLINVYYSRNITLEEAAGKLFVSKSQLNRLVRQQYGMTFHRLISSRRLEAAARLLSETDFTAERISTLVGFRTKSCFYDAFIERYGVTPNGFRKMNSVGEIRDN